MKLNFSFDDRGHRYLNASRILALACVMAIHAFALLLLCVPTSPGKNDTPTANDEVLATGVTLVMIGPPVPTPPPPAGPVVSEKPAEIPAPERRAEVVATQSEEDPTQPDLDAITEQNLPPIEITQIQEVSETVEHANEALFDAMANGAEPNPDLPPTEQMAYRRTHPPVYPSKSRRSGESGWVILRVLVDAQGFPIDFVIDPRTTASAELAQAAIDAVQWWQFHPAMKNGSTVRAWMEVPIGFFNSRKPKVQPPQPVASIPTN